MKIHFILFYLKNKFHLNKIYLHDMFKLLDQMHHYHYNKNTTQFP